MCADSHACPRNINSLRWLQFPRSAPLRRQPPSQPSSSSSHLPAPALFQLLMLVASRHLALVLRLKVSFFALLFRHQATQLSHAISPRARPVPASFADSSTHSSFGSFCASLLSCPGPGHVPCGGSATSVTFVLLSRPSVHFVPTPCGPYSIPVVLVIPRRHATLHLGLARL